MKRIVVALTCGVCAVPLRATAEPRAAKSAAHAKVAAPLPEREESAYVKLVTLADADGDGEVASTELEVFVQRHVQKQVEARFRRLDRNRDGRVVYSEVSSMALARFARFDADRDGGFSLAELESVMQQQAAERCRVVFAELDADGDGELTMADAAYARPTRVSERKPSTDQNRKAQR